MRWEGGGEEPALHLAARSLPCPQPRVRAFSLLRARARWRMRDGSPAVRRAGAHAFPRACSRRDRVLGGRGHGGHVRWCVVGVDQREGAGRPAGGLQ